MGTGEREPVGRGLDVLIWICTHPNPPWSVRSIARELDTSPTTVHRIFGTFESRGLLERDGDGGYVPGLELFRISHTVAAELSPARLARPHLEALSNQFSETAMLGTYNSQRGEMIYLDVVQSAHPVRYIIEKGMWMKIHAGATGLAILSFLPEQERRAIYKRGLAPLTDQTVTTEEDLELAAAQIRQVGWVSTHGQRTVGAVGTAAPVFDAAAEVFGDVCITIPEQRFDDRLTETIGAAVAATAKNVTAELCRAGYRRGTA
jgi:IclR family acetate operon transcriptional repressor